MACRLIAPRAAHSHEGGGGDDEGDGESTGGDGESTGGGGEAMGGGRGEATRWGCGGGGCFERLDGGSEEAIMREASPPSSSSCSPSSPSSCDMSANCALVDSMLMLLHVPCCDSSCSPAAPEDDGRAWMTANTKDVAPIQVTEHASTMRARHGIERFEAGRAWPRDGAWSSA